MPAVLRLVHILHLLCRSGLRRLEIECHAGQRSDTGTDCRATHVILALSEKGSSNAAYHGGNWCVAFRVPGFLAGILGMGRHRQSHG